MWKANQLKRGNENKIFESVPSSYMHDVPKRGQLSLLLCFLKAGIQSHLRLCVRNNTTINETLGIDFRSKLFASKIKHDWKPHSAHAHDVVIVNVELALLMGRWLAHDQNSGDKINSLLSLSNFQCSI